MPEILNRYLDQFTYADEITLVGPLVRLQIGPQGTTQIPFTDPVIFVDGGSRLRSGTQGISVGDGDSYHGILDYQLDREKDFSDLAYALSLVGDHFRCLKLHGFLGGRRDHELLNFGEVHHFLQQKTLPTEVQFDQHVSAFSAGQWQTQAQGTFSIVAFAPAAISLSGQCKYPIEAGSTLRPVSSLGLSNEGYGTIQLDIASPVFIFHNRHLDVDQRLQDS